MSRQAAARRRMLTYALASLCASLAVLAFVPPALEPLPIPETGARLSGASGSAGAAGSSENLPLPSRIGGPAFERPIFVEARRFDGSAPLSGVSGRVSELKLMAVFLGPETQKALIVTAPAPDGLWVGPGANIDGWKVEAIAAEHVVLAGAGGRQRLDLEKPENTPVKSRPKLPRKPKLPRRGRTSSQNPPGLSPHERPGVPSPQERGERAAPGQKNAADPEEAH